MDEKIIELLKELQLQINYLCYDTETLKKAKGLWEAFYELEDFLNKKDKENG